MIYGNNNVKLEGVLEQPRGEELYDDTNPMQTIAKFFVESVGDDPENKKNVIFVKLTSDMGGTEQIHPIKDKYRFNPETEKYEIIKLYKHPVIKSYIERFPLEWNAFMSGKASQVVGIPLSELFKYDPSRVDTYKMYHIETVEQLAAQGDAAAQKIGMGVSDDIKKAKAFLSRIKEMRPSLEINAKLEEKDRQLKSLQDQVADLTSKLTQVLQDKLNENEKTPSVKKKVPSKKILETSQENITE